MSGEPRENVRRWLKWKRTKAELIASGFDNVKAEPLSDLKNEWLHKDGAIKSITIDGQEKFGAGFFFDKHAEIVIEYHSFK